MLFARVQPSAGIKMVLHYSDELLIINKIAKSQPQWNVWYLKYYAGCSQTFVRTLCAPLACEPHYATRPIYSQKSHNSVCETIMKLYCIIDHLTRNLYIKQYYIH